jgi:hypothetical protein
MGGNGAITRLWRVTVSVTGRDRTLRCYTETLQLPVALHSRKYRHAEVGPLNRWLKSGYTRRGNDRSGNGERESSSRLGTSTACTAVSANEG